MLAVCPTEIVYQHELGRKPTEYDIKTGIGFYEFADILKENDWCDRNEVAKKTFSVTHSRGTSYIEWRATVIAS